MFRYLPFPPVIERIIKTNNLTLTNTLTRTRERFIPLKDGEVTIYCCGVTVYDFCHLGHARSYIAWDVLRRYLIWLGYRVTFVQNYTDIDDKIISRAKENNITIEEVSERNIAAYVSDMAALNITPADRMPRATTSLDAIRSLIQDLESKGAAYSMEGFYLNWPNPYFLYLTYFALVKPVR